MTCGRDGLPELLERAGLETVGDGRAGDVLPPRAAWRPVMAHGAGPIVSVRRDRPDLIAELNARMGTSRKFWVTTPDGRSSSRLRPMGRLCSE